MTGEREAAFVWDCDPCVQAVVTAIPDKTVHKQEDAIEENVDFDLIDTELMKRGTLAHDQIDWQKVGESSLRLLVSVQKNLRVVEALILRLLEEKPDGYFPTAVLCLYRFLDLDPNDRQPASAKRFKATLKRICRDMVNHPAVNWNPAEPERLEFERLVDLLCKNPDIENAGFVRLFKELVPRAQEETATKPGNPEDDGKKAPVAKPPAGASSLASIKKPDERALRKTANDLADIIFSQSAENSLSYELRRFATWSDINGPPPIKDKENSVIVPVSLDTRDAYYDQLNAGTIDPDVILRLERALMSLPFWLEGHFICWSLVSKAGWDDAALRIQTVTEKFLKRCPQLAKLNYADGAPLLPDVVAGWIRQSPAFPEAEKPNSSEAIKLESLVTDLFETSANELREVDAKVFTRGSVRAKTLYELAELENLNLLGLPELAATQAKRLKQSLKDTVIDDWDPEIISRIDTLGSNGSGFSGGQQPI